MISIKTNKSHAIIVLEYLNLKNIIKSENISAAGKAVTACGAQVLANAMKQEPAGKGGSLRMLAFYDVEKPHASAGIGCQMYKMSYYVKLPNSCIAP